MKPFWTDNELKILRDNYTTKGPSEISRMMGTGRSPCAVKCKGEKLRLDVVSRHIGRPAGFHHSEAAKAKIAASVRQHNAERAG